MNLALPTDCESKLYSRRVLRSKILMFICDAHIIFLTGRAHMPDDRLIREVISVRHYVHVAVACFFAGWSVYRTQTIPRSETRPVMGADGTESWPLLRST